MGYFSWMAHDGRGGLVSIAIDGSAREAFPVHLLQPDGQPPITETEYDGHGVFGGVDAYVWLAHANIPADRLEDLDEGEVRSIGVMLDCGKYHVDTVDGSKHSIFHSGARLLDPEIMEHPVTYAEPIAHFGGATANDLIESGRLVSMPFPCERPLKFSTDPDARYEALGPSPDCPHQGIYYEEERGEDGHARDDR